MFVKIPVNGGCFPVAQFKSGSGQRRQQGLFFFEKQAQPAALFLLKEFSIKLVKIIMYRTVEFVQREEMFIAECSSDPSRDIPDSTLCIGFVFWGSDACRDDCCAVVFCQLLIGFIELLVFPTAIMDDCRFAVIRNQDPGNTAKEFIHMDMCIDPGSLLHIQKGFYIRILAVCHYTDKYVCHDDLAGIGIIMAESPAQSTSTCSPGLRLICIVARCFCSSCWI